MLNLGLSYYSVKLSITKLYELQSEIDGFSTSKGVFINLFFVSLLIFFFFLSF